MKTKVNKGKEETRTKDTEEKENPVSMEALETAIRYWEDALDVYRSSSDQGALTNEEESEFCHQLMDLHDAAFELQEKCELLFLDERSVLFRASSRSRRDSNRTYMSSAESFVSAQDEIADLKEFEEFAEDLIVDLDRLNLYQAAQKQFENEGGIPFRCLRTELVHCRSDVEFLCKLHCVRLAFQWMFKDPTVWRWFADSGRQVLIDLLLFADKDPKDFLIAYEDMLTFLQDVESWEAMEQELSQKNVKAMTFYDVLLDYILMDAFDELESPPSTVTAVIQNKWLSNRFKESALTTAVWTVLKTKRRYLKYSNGFNAHFYSISEHISPLMAWGCLGPDEELRQICQYFKDQVINFLIDIFSFQSCRYTTVQDLSEDILRHAKTRIENVSCRLAGNVAPPEMPRIELPSP
ncbi:hypothetical protein M8J77_016465 [Diaphorina citri]|nr:hypothetical protein M8J77_016465 [Diaphorina citri]